MTVKIDKSTYNENLIEPKKTKRVYKIKKRKMNDNECQTDVINQKELTKLQETLDICKSDLELINNNLKDENKRLKLKISYYEKIEKERAKRNHEAIKILRDAVVSGFASESGDPKLI